MQGMGEHRRGLHSLAGALKKGHSQGREGQKSRRENELRKQEREGKSGESREKK